MLALDAAFGMEYLHLKNIVHFDLKCENLLVNLGDPQRPVCKVNFKRVSLLIMKYQDPLKCCFIWRIASSQQIEF